MRRLLAAALVGALSITAAQAETIETVITDLELREAAAPVKEHKGWRPLKKVVVIVDRPDRIAWLQDVAPGVQLIPAASPRDAIPLLKDADALIGACAAELVAAAKKAVWIHTGFAGVEDCVTRDEIRSGRILLTNMQRVSGGIMAEHVLAMMFTLSRGITHYVRSQDREEFNARVIPLTDLWEVKGRTMLIVGLGGIGTEVAKRAHALGMNVIATRNSGTGGPPSVSYVGKAAELPELVKQADVIVSAVPLTPQTTGLFDAAMFARMQPHALFINVGRGESVVQEDLIAALNEKRLGGAALDVMTPEPLPKGHPLWKARNILITPHVSGWSGQRADRIWLVNRENLRRYMAGEKMLSVVDPTRGY
jgi:phosphoglycerate dehydrogenase-like enzyme